MKTALLEYPPPNKKNEKWPFARGSRAFNAGIVAASPSELRCNLEVLTIG